MCRSSACWRAGGSMLVVRVTVDATSKIVIASQAPAMDMSRRTVELAGTWHHQTNARGGFCSSVRLPPQRHTTSRHE